MVAFHIPGYREHTRAAEVEPPPRYSSAANRQTPLLVRVSRCSARSNRSIAETTTVEGLCWRLAFRDVCATAPGARSGAKEIRWCHTMPDVSCDIIMCAKVIGEELNLSHTCDTTQYHMVSYDGV